MHASLTARFAATFGRPPALVGRAPGRIEFIGNHTDYNGGTVLGAAIDRGVWVAVAPREDGVRRFFSDQGEGGIVTLGLQVEKQSGAAAWVNYPLGVLAALPAFGLAVPAGFDLAVAADLPTGAGLSSSAAIELASALAFMGLTGQTVDPVTLVKVGRHAENHFVGMPCGILDQGVSGFGERNRLVHIDCRGPVFTTVPMPQDAHFWIFNSHVKHALVDGLYAERHAECMAAAAALGVACLADASLAQLEAGSGAMSEVAARRARHVIEEIGRVGETVRALEAGDLATVGRLLTASHRSSQHQFENSTPELDRLVDTLVATPGVWGARLTGGGFGGAVMALTADGFGREEAERVAATYAARYGQAPDILHLLTGDGARRV